MTEVVTKNALRRLNELSQASQSIQAAIAYWAFPPGQLDPSFTRATAHPDGFLCCDLHSPTSVDSLVKLKQGGSNLFLHLFQLVGKTEVPDSKGIPDHLMHSKLLVFNTEGADCTIWVGSHNATARALTGINFECAVVLRAQKGSELHRNVMAHLDSIRRKSTAFMLEDADYYRALQGGQGADGFIELEDRTGSLLAPSSEVTVFGSFGSDYQQLTKVGAKLYLAVSDAVKGTEAIYPVSIAQSGKLNPQTGRTLAFGPRRFAMKADINLPLLLVHQSVPTSVYDSAVFFAVLKVDEALRDSVAVELPPEKLWEDVSISEYLEGSDEDALRLPLGQEGPRGFRIQRAARSNSEALNSRERSSGWDVAFLALPLSERGSLQSRSLFRRRLLVRRSEPALQDPGSAET